MNPQQDFNALYTDISESIASAMAEISKLKVEHKDGKQELTKITDRLQTIRARFDDELKLLEKHAEWDKFTIAFFGETNAGKSTIIESLRIMFKEESRKKLLLQNSHDLDQYEEALNHHINTVRESFGRIYAEYACEIREIRKSAALLRIILQEESTTRIKRKCWMFALGGASAATVVAVFITILWRG